MEKRYLVIDQCSYGDEFEDVFKTFDEANSEAKYYWHIRTRHEKEDYAKGGALYVSEVNEDDARNSDLFDDWRDEAIDDGLDPEDVNNWPEWVWIGGNVGRIPAGAFDSEKVLEEEREARRRCDEDDDEDE